MLRISLLLAASLVLTAFVAARAGAQAPSLDDFKLRETTVDMQGRADALAQQLRKSDGGSLLDQANRIAVEGGACRDAAFPQIPAGSQWYCFDRDDAGEGSGEVEWIPQGVTSAADAAAGRPSLLVSWYDDAVEPKKGVRVSFLDPGTRRYRHVLLVYPTTNADGRPNYEIVGRPQGGIHAGGIAWYGHYLYVADTYRGLRVFDMRSILDLAASPNGDTADKQRVGWASGKYRGFGYRYVMPQVDAWVNAAGPDNSDPGFFCSPGGAPRFSSVAVDRSQASHALTTGTYCRSGDAGRVARWPLDAQTGRPVISGDGLVHATEAYRLARNQIQGAVSIDGTWYLSRSDGATTNGQLIVASPDASPVGSLRATETRPAGIGPEDLSYWPDQNRIWTVTEHAGRRMLYGVPRGAVLPGGLTAVAANSCGTFHVTGLQTSVHVRVVRGHTSCRTARAVLRSLFAHKRTRVRGWRCVGPQTGYSQCVRGSARIQGLF
jgi:hypothetical protein